MRTNERYTSIIIASYIPDDLRAKTFRTSLESLLETTKGRPVEIIVVDNGGSKAISEWLHYLCDTGEIQCYIKNTHNMHFGFARNQGINTAGGKYIVIADNDILYHDGWLEACWEVLEAYPMKLIYATPIDYPTPVLKQKYSIDKVTVRAGEEPYILSMRAGSNCFMVRERDLHHIGLFRHHRIAGTKWTDEAVHQGYLAAVCPGELAQDIGLRVGYNHREPLPIFRTLRDGSKQYFNQDEFEIPND